MMKPSTQNQKNQQLKYSKETLINDLGPTIPHCDLIQLILFIGNILIILLNRIYADFIPQWNIFIPIYIRAILASLFIMGSIIFARKAIYLVYSHNKSPSKVIQTGPFHISRHPMYLSALILFLGLFLITFSILGLIYYGMVCCFYIYMTNFEERALLVKFGQEYALYQKNVSKWIGQSKSNGQRSD